MPSSKSNMIKNSNINYIGRDFNDLKSSLINYTKSYFPNTYQDFNETSPGMMLLELSAYVGDVLNFYIDNQYKEMMLPLAEERRNIVTLAKSHGYKVNSISPAYTTLTTTVTVNADENGKPIYDDAPIIDKGMQVASSTDPSLVFETLSVMDFKISSSLDPQNKVREVDPTTGVPKTYTFTRKVKAISGETKTKDFTIGEPVKFKKIVLPESNVIEVLKVQDSNGSIWYEVDSLSKDKVYTEKHYSSDDDRAGGYNTPGTSALLKTPVPYSLEFIKTSKRFVTEVDSNNKMSLVFGNGMLKNGNSFGSTFLAVEQVGINLPGGEENLETSIDPLMGDAYGTLGEAPSNTTLTVTYRVGGGVGSNVSANLLTTVLNSSQIGNGSAYSTLAVINEQPAAGGTSGETIEEIRHRAMGHISTQNRCVSKEDYEARTLNMPAKFGNIAKVYCSRAGAIRTSDRKKVSDLVGRLKEIINKNYDMFNPNLPAGEKMVLMNDIKNLLDADKSGGLNPEDFDILFEVLDMSFTNITDDDRLYTIDLYLLSYDQNKNLIATPNIIKQNLKQYLTQFRMLTDQVSFYDGFVVNFGVVFDVVGQSYESKDQIKIKCIEAIKEYFRIDKLQFKQTIYSKEVENLLMDVDGVKTVNYVTLTQDYDYHSPAATTGTEDPVFNPPLYSTVIQSNGTSVQTDNSGYGYYYDFSKFYGASSIAGMGIVLPAYEPAVFELKDPNNNVRGVVR